MLRKNARELGLVSSLLYGIDRAFVRAGLGLGVALDYLVGQPIRTKPMLPGKRGASIAVREIGPDDPALSDMPLDAEEREKRRRIAALGFGAFQDGVLIGYLWFSFTFYEERDIRLRFVPEPKGAACWDFDIYIRPEHRLGFAFLRLWDAANAELAARGVRWTISRISGFNPHSIASHKRLGAIVLRRLITVRIARCRIHVATRPWAVRLSGGGAWPTLGVQAPDGEGT